MAHDASIPQDLHTGARGVVKSSLGSFWSDIFEDQDLLDSVIAAKILEAAQLHIDVMESLSLRDHTGSPLFHREHWHPLIIRRSERNSAPGLVIGMPDTPSIGPQKTSPDNPHPYIEGEVFEVGRNDDQSKVFTYPFKAFDGCRLVSVRTCICDSVAKPGHLLMQGRDFTIDRGTLTIRRESDPFDVGGYRTIEMPGSYTDATTGIAHADSLAVLWLCDAEFDTNNVGDFLGYPMGIDAASTPVAKECLAALWDAVVYGLTPRCLNVLLGALFRVPTAAGDETVEVVRDDAVSREVCERELGGLYNAEDCACEPACSDDHAILQCIAAGGSWDYTRRECVPEGQRRKPPPFTESAVVVTDKRVYAVRSGAVAVAPGLQLQRGDFLTNEIRVVHGLSADEIEQLVEGPLSTLSIPAGGVLGVRSTVVVQNLEDNPVPDGTDWFKLSEVDSEHSPFWDAVRSRTTLAERQALVATLRSDGKINPMRALGYDLMANTVLIRLNGCQIADDPCARQVYREFLRLIPSYASVLVLDESGAPYEPPVTSLSAGIGDDVVCLTNEDTVDCGLTAVLELTEKQTLTADDDVAFTFVPLTGTEV